LADDGRSVITANVVTPGPNGVGTVSTPSVILGEPGASGSGTWSAPVSISSFGTRSGASVSNLRVQQLLVAPNGRAMIVLTGLGGGCPATTPGQATWCYFVTQMDPIQRTWTPLDPVIRYPDANSPGDFQVGMNSRGDMAGFFEFVSFAGRSATAVWRAAPDIVFQSLPISSTAPAFRNANITVDETGRLALAAAITQSGSTDLVLWRGSASAGLQSPTVVDSRLSPVSFRWLWTGRNGESYVLWTQNNGAVESLYGARFTSSTATVVPEDLGPNLIDLLSMRLGLPPQALAGTVNDAGELLFNRYNGNSSAGSTCATFRWDQASAPRSIDTALPCTMDQPGNNNTSGNVGVARSGHLLTVRSNSAWASYDATLNAQVSTLPALGVTSGQGFAYGVSGLLSRSTSSRAVDLSTSGIAAMTVIANVDVWPTPATPSGDGRPTVRNLWAIYFR
jgi:hypothetical protein